MREIIRQANIAPSILAHPLGLSLCLGPDSAVDVESRAAPGKQTFCPFGAEEFPAAELAHQPAIFPSRAAKLISLSSSSPTATRKARRS
jgi:hypothetical protein